MQPTNEGPNVLTVAAQESPAPQTHEEARQFHEGFLAGATAYAAAVGYSTLLSENAKLRDVFDAQGWRTIETFDSIAAKQRDTCPDCGRSFAKKECQCA